VPDPADGCPFCLLGAGGADEDLVVLRERGLFVIPTLKQRPANPGQVIIVPVAHLTSLHLAGHQVRAALAELTARVTGVVGVAFGATGSTVLQNNTAPDQPLLHLHVRAALTD
jgi:histidine triad (HIT) family protein